MESTYEQGIRRPRRARRRLMNPCPFCGCVNVRVQTVGEKDRAKCQACGALGPDSPMEPEVLNPSSVNDALRLWNQRFPVREGRDAD